MFEVNGIEFNSSAVGNSFKIAVIDASIRDLVSAHYGRYGSSNVEVAVGDQYN